jgi:hypothetical protein
LVWPPSDSSNLLHCCYPLVLLKELIFWWNEAFQWKSKGVWWVGSVGCCDYFLYEINCTHILATFWERFPMSCLKFCSVSGGNLIKLFFFHPGEVRAFRFS